jgi:hypothetical protein
MLEARDPFLEFGQAGEVAWGERFALQDREIDLDLVQPGGVHGQVDEHEVGPGVLEAVDRALAAVAAAVVPTRFAAIVMTPSTNPGGLGEHQLAVAL